MKKLIYSIAALSLLILLNSCDCKDVSDEAQYEVDFLKKIINEQQSIITANKDLNYCTTRDAVELGSYYNTIEGTAILKFRIPKGHELKLDAKRSKPSKNKLYYICDGEEYSDDTKEIEIEIDGLRSGDKAESARLYVYLTHTFRKNKCTNFDVLEEKHKGTVVDGEPLHGEK